jgi:hypothetical protein
MGDESAPLQFAEPLGEQVAACPRYPAMDLVEAAGTDHQLAKNQGGPPVAQHVDRAGDRAVLPAARHDPILASRTDTG